MLELDKTYLGIELGSIRIMAVLIDEKYTPLASGSHDWENKLENGYWTYSLDDIHNGIRSCFASLAADVKEKHDYKAGCGRFNGCARRRKNVGRGEIKCLKI